MFMFLKNIHHQVILGDDFLSTNKAVIDRGNKTIELADGVHISTTHQTPNSCMVRTTKHVNIPPSSEAIIPVRVARKINGQTALIEPVKATKGSQPLMVAKTVVKLDKSRTGCRILNYSDETLHLSPGTVVAIATAVDETLISSLDESQIPTVNSTNQSKKIDTPLSPTEAIDIAKTLNIDTSSPLLTPSMKDKLLELIGKNRDVFATNLNELGKTNIHMHAIETGDAQPVRLRPYRNSPNIERELNRQLIEMEENGIIEPSTALWQSPVVMVKKKTGEYRVAIDYRKLNAVTKQISFPLPRLDNVFDKLGQANANWFTTLDLASGFWQVPLDPQTKEKTSFITNDGQKFNFTVLPFGLVNSPSTYQMVMDKVLQGLNWKILLCYIDDIIIFSSTLDEHLEHLELVFQRLRQANLTLKPNKCTFASERVMYLGHYLSKRGIEVDPSKVDAVKSFPTPTNPKAVRSFIGLCSFYRRFIKDFSKIASPLHKLTSKDTQFVWTPKCEQAFQTLKIAMTTTPVFRFPDWNKPFVLTTDASVTAISYILGQKDENGKEYAVAYGGRSLRGAEIRYAIHELECLAMVEGIRAYHHYLSHQEFCAITDNIALTWLKTAKHTTSRLLRWALCLQGYNYEIIHRKGILNKNADALSRREYVSSDSPQSKVEESCLEETAVILVDPHNFEPVTMQVSSMSLADKQADPESLEVTLEYAFNDKSQDSSPQINAMSATDLSQAQHSCPDFSAIYHYLETGELPSDTKLAHKTAVASDQYIIDNGVLFHMYSPRTQGIPKELRVIRQLAVPTDWREDILRSYHDSLFGGGHQGFDRTYASIRMKYYWPKMYAEILDYIKTCDPCQKSKHHFHAHPAPLQNMPIEGRFDRWHIDILGPLAPSSEGHKYILVVVDSYTRWPEAFPLKNQTATEIGKVLYREIFSRYGAPRALLSDRGQNFMSKLVTAICQLFQVTRLHTSSYHPATNSTCERLNSTLAQALRTYCPNSQPNWPDMIPGILMAHRMTPATQSTSLSPYFMVFGKEMPLPIDTSLRPKDTLPATTQTELGNIVENLKLAEKIAAEKLKNAQTSSKDYYDKGAKLPSYKEGDRVLVYNPKRPKGIASKTFIKWQGPYYITKVGPHYTYILRDASTHKELTSPVHANRMKPYHDPNDRRLLPPRVTDDQATLPAPTSYSDNALNSQDDPVIDSTPDIPVPELESFTAEKLLATRVRYGKRYYRVKWEEGLNIKPSWEPRENVSEALLRHFHVTHTKAGKRRKRKLPLT